MFKQISNTRCPNSFKRSDYSLDRINRSAHNKTEREFEYSVLDKTRFESEKAEFLRTISQVRNLRAVEYAGRFVDVRLKAERLQELDLLVKRLKELLEGMALACEMYRQLMEGQPPHSAKRAVPENEANSFAGKMVKEVKAIEAAWCETIKEGSLRRLDMVLALVGLSFKLDLEFDIRKWALEAEKCFRAQTKRACCSRLLELN